MKAILVAITAIATLFVGPALAADMAVKTAPPALLPPAPIYSWTGCYAGAGIGYAVADIHHSTTDPSGVVFDAGHDNSAKGWLGMLGAGCDLQVYTRWVVGVTRPDTVSGTLRSLTNMKGDLTLSIADDVWSLS